MVTQISLILLLFGTIVGDFALISDVSARAFTGLAAPSKPPAWLVAYNGRGTMCLFALVAVFPLCCLKGMRQVGRSKPHDIKPFTYTAMLVWNHHVPEIDVFMLELLQTATVDSQCPSSFRFTPGAGLGNAGICTVLKCVSICCLHKARSIRMMVIEPAAVPRCALMNTRM